MQKKMIHAISVGLRRDVVRLEMMNSLNDAKISDSKLLKELHEVVTRDTENRKKMEKNQG